MLVMERAISSDAIEDLQREAHRLKGSSLILGLVAGLILLILRLRRPRRAATGTIGVEALLLAATDQVRRDPWSSIATAAVLGAIAEILRSASSRPQT